MDGWGDLWGEYIPAMYGWGVLWGDGIYYQPWMAGAIYGGGYVPAMDG